MNASQILQLIPQTKPFRFIDEILEIDENHIIGTYRFREDEFFYQGHFPDQPVTPGVILTETAAQIGLVAFGVYLNSRQIPKDLANQDPGGNNQTFSEGMAFTSVLMDYLKPVFPGEKVWVKAEKIYFRFQKLKVTVRMYTEDETVICKGELSGMMGRKKL